MNLRIDRSQVFHVFAVEDAGILSDLRLWATSEQDPRYLLYLAKVKKILPAVNGAILDLGDREAYLGWQDLDPDRKGRGAKIAEVLRLEDRLLVQIRREESGDKADKASLRIAVPGAYGVYLPRERGLSISAKIRDPQTRKTLESGIACQASEGVILRTLAAETSVDVINEEIGRLRAAFQQVERLAMQAKSLGAFALEIDPEPAFFARWLKAASVLISNRRDDQQIAASWDLEFLLQDNPLDAVWMDLTGLRKAKVPLRSMEADILVEELETLTAIDVNRKAAARASVAKVDQEAVVEAMRQLRLRNIGGMVVMDVIDKKNGPRTTRTVTREKRRDSHPIRVYGPSAMGLIEWVRTKRGASLLQLTGDEKNPTGAYALWRLVLASRKAPKASAVKIQGSAALIEALQADDQWKSWEIPGHWKRIDWEILGQKGEFLRIVPSLRK